jgi:hypothetical protein
MIELQHFCDRSDRGTLFGDLRILDLRTPNDLAGRRNEVDDSWRRVVAAVRIPKITKSDGTPDRRFEGWWNDDDTKLWPILSFVDRLSRIADEGDLTAPHHRWQSEEFRPAQVVNGCVYFLDWPLLPVYVSGGFKGFAENLVILLETVRDVMEEATTR